MSVEGQESVQGAESVGTTGAESPAGPQGSPETTPTEGMGEAPPAYTPSFKYKVLSQEKEFDEWAKAAVKDADTEKAVRDLYEKAYGLDFVKTDRAKIKEERDSIKAEHNGLVGSLKQLGTFRQKGDWASFFQSLNVSDDDILKHALKVAELREMPQEQRQAYEAQQAERQRLYQLEQENQHLSEQYTSVAVQGRTQELDLVMSNPDVVSAAQAFDARMGQEGAFKAAVIERGKFHWLHSQTDIPAQQAVAEVLRFIGHQQQQAPAQQQMSQPQALAQPVVSQPQAQKKVIPNIQGRGTSPAQKIPKSIEDLKRMRDEMRS